MKRYLLLLGALLASSFAACSHLPFTSAVSAPATPPEALSQAASAKLNAFLDEATIAAKQIETEDDIEIWKTECEKVKRHYEELPQDDLSASLQKECDKVMDQMLLGKLAMSLEKASDRSGRKERHAISLNISQSVKKIKGMTVAKA